MRLPTLLGFGLLVCLSGACTSAPNRGEAHRSTREEKSTPVRETYRIIGRSVEGRPIEAFYFGSGRETILILAGQHGDEKGTVPLALDLVADLRKTPVPERVQVVVVPRANPDGLAHRTRWNARKVDLNRNFPSRDWEQGSRSKRYRPGPHPASEPETRALMVLIDILRPARIVSIHGPLAQVNYDGPGRALAEKMAEANGLPVTATVGYPTPGSLGSYTGKELNLPTITLELKRKGSREERWKRHKDALWAAIRFPSRPPQSK